MMAPSTAIKERPMKTLLTCAVVLLVLPTLAAAASFDEHFRDETMRIDYFHTGAAGEEIVALDQVWRQGKYAGSRTHLVDDLDLGRYLAKLYDAAGGALIWSRGFDSYFGEWLTTGPAGEGVRRTYHESVLAPLPLAPVVFTLEGRQKDGTMKELFRAAIDPNDFTIRRDALAAGVVVVDAAVPCSPDQGVDIAILGEGYTAAQEAKFRTDVAHFAGVLLNHEPYKAYAAHINIRGVLKPSQESGCDEPSRGVYRNTALGCSFDALGSERYLLTEDNRAIRDVAAAVPYDILYIMVNHDRYGGGGIYNLFCAFTSDNQWSDYVFLHEFGHAFAGLADEYYSSSTSYTDFYPRDVEPRERNITTLLDPAHLKWADLVTPGTAIPTPWEKTAYDAMDGEYQRRRAAINDRIAQLMRDGAPADAVERAKADGEKESWDHQKQMDVWFAGTAYAGKVGAFEGAGYCSEGMYRSELDCIMFSKGVKPFCAACRRGIIEVIERQGN
jgi:hypothetical protein